MTLSGGGKVKRGRTNSSLSFSFDGCTFIFPSVTCWCEKHDFSTFFLHILTALASNLQNFFLAFFPYTLLTRHSSTADTKVFFSIPPLRSLFLPPLPTPSNKENWKSFQFQGETTFYFYPCVLKAQILMTLTLNENEVAINYIKYDFLRCFFGATLCKFLFECYRKMCLHAQPSRAFEPNFSSSVRMAAAGRNDRLWQKKERTSTNPSTSLYETAQKVADYEKYTT